LKGLQVTGLKVGVQGMVIGGRKVLPPIKNPVTIRVDADVLAWLKR
jgi:uncharacterized protein (DUF4415 family)